MLTAVRQQVYGVPISTEEWSAIRRDLFNTALKVHQGTRSGGSPYALTFDQVLGYVRARVEGG